MDPEYRIARLERRYDALLAILKRLIMSDLDLSLRELEELESADTTTSNG